MLLCPCWKIDFCSYPIWLQFSYQAGFGSNLVRLGSGSFWDLQLMCFSVYCRKLCSCLKGVDIRFHPLMILFFLLLVSLQIHVLLLTYFYLMLFGIWVSKILILYLLFFIMQTATIFVRKDKIITGRWFNVGLPGFPGYCSALKHCAWFHLGAFVWLQYHCIYLQFCHTQLLVSNLLVLH